MPDYNVIADVSNYLAQVITDGLKELAPLNSPQAIISDLQTVIPTDPPKLTLFLFEIVEDASTRNRPREYRPENNGAGPNLEVRKPPMTLLLRYLLTAWSGDRPTEHRILGRVLQMFYETPILTPIPPDFPNLSSTAETMRITLAPLTLEERARVWYAIQQRYKLSLSYEVRVVNLNPTASQVVSPVSNRRLAYAVPGGAP